jgi:aspartyl-tRNA synthetase
MQFVEMTEVVSGANFNVFDKAELVVGLCAKGAGEYSRKQLDALTDFVRRPQIGAMGVVYCKCNADGTFKSSVDKFYNQEALKNWAEATGAEPGDLVLVMAGETERARKQLCGLRLHMGDLLGLKDPNNFKALWIVDFPLVEWDEDSKRFHAMHHPFTSPNPEDLHLMDTDPGAIRANAYDMVINGSEIGGGSIRIHDRGQQEKMFEILGFTEEEANAQFGFLMEAFEYGAPPHGGAAFGFDRFTALFGGQTDIRDFIAFPKNNSGRDVMIDSPAVIDSAQLDELSLALKLAEKKD